MERKTPPTRTYPLVLNGQLKGFHVTLSSMSAREVVAIKSGMSEDEALDLVERHVIEHDFDVEHFGDLDYWIVNDVLKVWRDAMNQAALPEANGGS